MSKKLTFFLIAVLVVGLLPMAAATAQDDETVTTAVIPPALVSPFHVAVQDGAVEKAEELGWNIITQSPERETDFEAQVAIVEQVVQQGVDILGVNPINADAMIAGVRVANEAGIPVTMHNMITPIAEGDVVEYIGYDQWGGASNLAAYTCGLLAGKQGVDVAEATGKVFILTGIPGFHANRRTGGFKYGLEQNCPNVEVVGEQTAEWEREKALQLATTALQQNPDIDVFFGNSDEMAIGAALAAQQLGLTVGEDIFSVGIDGNDVTLDLIREGTVTATLGVYPKRMGETVIVQQNKILNGENVPYILLTPSTVVDLENLDAYIAGDTWTDPVEGQPEVDNGEPTVPEGDMGGEAEATIYEGATTAVIPPALVSPFHVAVQDGAVEKAGEYGWEIITQSPERETDFEAQVAIVEQVVQQGVDILGVNPINADAMIAGVRVANEAGIPVTMHNMITPIAEGDVVEYIGYDQWGGASNLAAYTCGLLAGKQGVDVAEATGKVFILTGIPGFHANRRTGGFKYGLEQNCPNVEVVGEQTAEWEREKALQLATTALQQNPDIDVFFGNSDEMAIGAALAAQQLGLTVGEDIFSVGIDGNDVTLDLIREGTVTATLGVYPKRMGETVIVQQNKILNGENVPYILLTPSTVVDLENLDAYIAGDTWTDPVEGQPEIDNGEPTVPEM
ncbi:MAG TPA: sugar ABC transporter substrate-binding protein [Aggregatilinea sp.]|uniref:sugar ABC transporter substrate-binding protein n=1 Tax=Aggregatilinea sp. TaxID=2806333 RepID=UPI002BDEF4B7|nr:sugar ABC transporter substrate-binding protein [Aggregatilinea sp.]HML23466.1 sugar ABC transporter substrate-binding protein [Aggregatilinea sp.]